LPFDHGRIIAAAVERVRNKSQYSSLPVHLCPEPFTLPQLHGIYQALLGEAVNPVSFRRKMEELAILEVVPGAKRAQGPHRPAQLYRLKDEFKRTLRLVGRGLNA
jgi:8-oxo-dGTP diphosphatase